MVESFSVICCYFDDKNYLCGFVCYGDYIICEV